MGRFEIGRAVKNPRLRVVTEWGYAREGQRPPARAEIGLDLVLFGLEEREDSALGVSDYGEAADFFE
jgi:hypothetical protein